jgi:uncharacterized protein YecT (DUF1311 family)
MSLAQTYEDGRVIFDKSDKKLNDAYQKLLLAKRSDKIFIRNLKASERIWIQFRDAQFSLKYPKHASVEKRDSLPMNQAIYLAQLTEDQTKVLLELLRTSTSEEVYVSDLKIIHSGDVHGGIGIDRPYWGDELKICGITYKKGLIIHPEDGGIIAYAEFLLPKKGGRLLGVAGWAEQEGVVHSGKMRFRIFVDEELLYGNELKGKECQRVNLELGLGKILRIETDDGDDGYIADHMAFGDLQIVY